MPNSSGYSNSYGVGSANRSMKINAAFDTVNNNLKSNSKNVGKIYSNKYW